MRQATAFNAFIEGFKQLLASGAETDALFAYCEKYFGNEEQRALSERLLAPYYVPIIVEPDVPVEAHDTQAIATARTGLRAFIAEAFASVKSGVEIIERNGSLLVLVPAPREIDASNARTAAALLPRSAAKRNADLCFFAGIGECVPALEIARGISQAEAALAIGRRVLSGERVAVYDALGIYPLLFEGADVARMREFAQRMLAPLRAYDEKHQTELEKTLRVYFTVGQNVKAASERLHVHRHTVFYRLRQINEICNCSLENERDQLTLRMALAIDTLHCVEQKDWIS